MNRVQIIGAAASSLAFWVVAIAIGTRIGGQAVPEPVSPNIYVGDVNCDKPEVVAILDKVRKRGVVVTCDNNYQLRP